MTLSEILLVTGVILVSSFIQGLSGFGIGTVAVPLLCLFTDVKVAVPLTLLFSVLMNTYFTVQLRQHIPWKKLAPLVIPILLGIPVGTYFLKAMPSFILKIALGAALIALAAYFLLVRPALKELHIFWAYLAGFFVGCLGASISTGISLVIYMSFQPWGKDLIKSTFAVCFLFLSVGGSISSALNGLVTSKVILYFFVSLPVLAVGTLLGHACYEQAKESLYRKIIIILILIIGIVTLHQGIFAS